MPSSLIALVNLPAELNSEISKKISDNDIGCCNTYTTTDLASLLSVGLCPTELVVYYDCDITEAHIAELSLAEERFIVFISKGVGFEMERTAKSCGIDFIVDIDRDDACEMTCSFLMQFTIYQRHKALIVDDSTVDCHITSNTLNLEFLPCLYERNPLRVIDVLNRDEKINILVLDYEMPELNGVELLTLITETFPNRPFVVLGLTGSRNGTLKFLSHGADGVFTKPLDSEHFSLSLRKIIFSFYTMEQERKRFEDYKNIIQHISVDAVSSINSLSMINERLLSSKVDETEKEIFLNTSLSAKKNLSAMFDDLLCYMSLTSQMNSPVVQSCCLQSLISIQLSLDAYQAKYKNIILSHSLESGVDLKCVPSQIESVISSFVGNAVKYSPNNSLVGVRMYTKDSNIHFEVEDSAQKISLDQQNKVFDPYSKITDINCLSGVKSMGFNLSLCKKIIDSHGGEVGIKHGSSGNIFYFKVPSIKGELKRPAVG